MDSKIQKIYGLIGYPLGHSFSQDFFNKKFDSEKINAHYVNFEIPTIQELSRVLANNSYLMGLNVTIPYKQQVIEFLDELDPEAKKIGAVNVIRINRKSNGEIASLKGYNSDIIGFTHSIQDMLKPSHKKALILGTGGASKAVYHGLLNLGVEPTLVSRTPSEGQLSYGDLTPDIMESHTVIVNTTPLGMFPHVDEAPNIPYHLLSSDHICYDVLYNPDTTLFMKKSAEYGAVTKNGLEMLLMQAFAAWDIWTQKR